MNTRVLKILHLTTTDMSLELLLGDQLSAFIGAGHNVLGVSAPGDFVNVLNDRGVKHIPLKNSTRNFSILSDIKAAIELYGIIVEERPDILHTHNPKPGIYGRIVGRLARVPLVVNTVHGLYATEDDSLVKKTIVYSLERFASMFSDIELVQSREDLTTLAKIGVSSKKTQLLGNGVSLSKFCPDDKSVIMSRSEVRQKFKISESSVLVGVVGRLVCEKGYRELFESIRLLKDRGVEFEVCVAGAHDLEKVDALALEEIDSMKPFGVTYVGEVLDMASLYHAMDIFVLPSYREGFPRSAMEAACAGLPLILTDIRGCREVVQNEVNGYLVRKKSVVELADAIETLVENQEKRIKFGSLSKAKAVTEFDDTRQIAVTLEAYKLVDKSL